MNLILIGFKSCGKTYFGKLLATQLKREWIDTDKLVEEIHEKTRGEKLGSREIAIQYGTEAFRKLEKQVIHALRPEKEVVISVGGGAVLDASNCQRLQKLGKLVYMQLDKETLKKRILSSPLPSFLDPKDPEGSFEEMHKMRKPLYEKIAEITIDVSGKDDRSVIEELIHGQ